MDCVRCGRPVEVSRDWYDVFERMHWVCFHYEFEHDGDPDTPCVDCACPSRPDWVGPPEEDDHMRCRVCGLRQAEPPWGRDGASPSFDFCPCCGIEFGYHDASVEGARRAGRAWLERGAPWAEPAARPGGWSASRQLARVPSGWRDPPPDAPLFVSRDAFTGPSSVTLTGREGTVQFDGVAALRLECVFDGLEVRVATRDEAAAVDRSRGRVCAAGERVYIVGDGYVVARSFGPL